MIIIGANSFIGKYLYEYFSKKEKVIGTYFSKPEENLIQFDISNPDLSKLGSIDKEKYCIVCSAIGRIDDCKKEEEKSYKINVEGTKKLIEQLFSKNITPVFLSSSYVFAGDKKNPDEKDERNPRTIYGRQKKEIEDFLIKSGKRFLVLRLSKVYGLKKGDNSLLTGMIEQISENPVNKYAKDQVMSPVYVEDIVKVLDLATERSLTGIYNVSGEEQFSWYDLAEIINNEFKLNKKIEACSINDFNFLEKPRPLNTGLNPGKMVIEIGINFLTLKEAINKLKEIYK